MLCREHPVVVGIKRRRIAVCFAVGVQLNSDRIRSDLVFVFVVFPNLLDADFSLFGVDYIVTAVSGYVAGHLILNDSIYDLNVLAVDLFILVKVGEAPCPVV